MTRLEKLKSLCAAATGGDMLTKGAYHFEMTGNFPALLALVEQQHKALEGINIWVANDDQHEIAAAMHKALTDFAAWNEQQEDGK